MQVFDHKSGEYLDVDGARIYYEITGNETSPVLLFLHGGFGNIEEFNDIIAELPEKFKIIGIDSRGQGKSTLGSQELTYELSQKDVENLLKHLNINEVSILGFSDGGTIAYRLASSSNIKVNKVISIGSPWHIKNEEPLKEFFLKLTGDLWKQKFPFHYESYQSLNPEPEFNHLTKLLVKMWLDASTSGYPNEQVSNISCPMLIVRGENDPVISSSDIIELSGHVKSKTQLFNIPSAGHEAFKDQHKLFMTKLKEFLEV